MAAHKYLYTVYSPHSVGEVSAEDRVAAFERARQELIEMDIDPTHLLIHVISTEEFDPFEDIPENSSVKTS